MRALACLLVVAALAACSSRDSRTPFALVPPIPPAGSSTPAPAPPITFTLAIVGTSTFAGPVGQVMLEPLLVEVRDSSGKPVDGVYVNFSSPTRQALGSATTGTGQFLVAPPGSGRAAVLAIPVIRGPAQVRATVIPTVASYATPQASSNDVFFVVVGQ